jgi:hypothetical protein
MADGRTIRLAVDVAPSELPLRARPRVFSSPNVKEPTIGVETDGCVVIGRDHLSERHPCCLRITMPVRAEAVCGGQEGETQRQEKKPRDPQREEWGTKPWLGCAAHLVSARSTGPATRRRSSAGPKVCEYRAVALGSPRTSCVQHGRARIFLTYLEPLGGREKSCLWPAPRFLPTAAPPALNTPRRTA